MELPSLSIEYTSRRGPFVGSEQLTVDFAATSLQLDRAHGFAGKDPIQRSSLASTSPSADVLRGTQLLRDAALAAGGVRSVLVATTPGAKDVHWTLVDGSTFDAPFAEAPSAIRDVITSAKSLHRVITGGFLGRTDPSFHDVR